MFEELLLVIYRKMSLNPAGNLAYLAPEGKPLRTTIIAGVPLYGSKWPFLGARSPTCGGRSFSRFTSAWIGVFEPVGPIQGVRENGARLSSATCQHHHPSLLRPISGDNMRRRSNQGSPAHEAEVHLLLAVARCSRPILAPRRAACQDIAPATTRIARRSA